MEFSAASETPLSAGDRNLPLCQDLGGLFSSDVKGEYVDVEHEEKQEYRPDN